MKELIFPHAEHTALLVVDVHDRLLASMPQDEVNWVLRHTKILIELANTYEWPVYYTEQYPQGLGATESSVLAKLEEGKATRCAKVEFSCLDNETFASSILPRLPSNIIVVGIEAHVCVLQTVLDLQARGYQTFVPGDAVASRDMRHKENGLHLMEKAGAVNVNTESIMFNALGKAGGEVFKKFSRLIR